MIDAKASLGDEQRAKAKQDLLGKTRPQRRAALSEREVADAGVWRGELASVIAIEGRGGLTQVRAVKGAGQTAEKEADMRGGRRWRWLGLPGQSALDGL